MFRFIISRSCKTSFTKLHSHTLQAKSVTPFASKASTARQIASLSNHRAPSSTTAFKRQSTFKWTPSLRSFSTENQTPIGEDEPEPFVPPPGMKVKESVYWVGYPVEPNWKNILIDLYSRLLEETQALPAGSPTRTWLEATTKWKLALVEQEDDYEVVERAMDTDEGQVEHMIVNAKRQISNMHLLVEMEKLRAENDPEANETVIYKKLVSDAYREP